MFRFCCTRETMDRRIVGLVHCWICALLDLWNHGSSYSLNSGSYDCCVFGVLCAWCCVCWSFIFLELLIIDLVFRWCLWRGKTVCATLYCVGDFRRPHTKLKRRPAGAHRTVAANMNSWSVDCDIGVRQMPSTRGDYPLGACRFGALGLASWVMGSGRSGSLGLWGP